MERYQRRRLVQRAARLRAHHRIRLRRRYGLRCDGARSGTQYHQGAAACADARPVADPWRRQSFGLVFPDRRRLGEGHEPSRRQACRAQRRWRPHRHRNRRMPSHRAAGQRLGRDGIGLNRRVGVPAIPTPSPRQRAVTASIRPRTPRMYDAIEGVGCSRHGCSRHSVEDPILSPFRPSIHNVGTDTQRRLVTVAPGYVTLQKKLRLR